MKHLKLFEEFTVKENFGEYNYTNGKSYIQYFKMKDTHSLVEFNGMDLESVYDIIGDHCIFIDKVYIHPDDSPLILRRFLNKVEEYAKEEDYNVIATLAEPFEDKRLNVNQLIELYQKFGFVVYEKLPDSEAYIMYKDL
jgi:GNAT superfamily N-acetyltransferase